MNLNMTSSHAALRRSERRHKTRIVNLIGSDLHLLKFLNQISYHNSKSLGFLIWEAVGEGDTVVGDGSGGGGDVSAGADHEGNVDAMPETGDPDQDSVPASGDHVQCPALTHDQTPEQHQASGGGDQGTGLTGRSMERSEDALSYLDNVKRRFRGQQRQIYGQFIEAVKVRNY